MKLKRLFIGFIAFCSLMMMVNVRAKAYYLHPSGDVTEYSSLSSVPYNMEYFGGGTLERGYLDMSQSSINNQRKYRIVKGNKNVCLPTYEYNVENNKILFVSNNTVGSEFTWTNTSNVTYTETFEESFTTRVEKTRQYGLTVELGFDIADVDCSINREILVSNSNTVGKSNSRSVSKSAAEEYTFLINTPGYYAYQDRSIYIPYLIQEVEVCYNLKRVNGKDVRIPGEKYFLVKETLKLIYAGGEFSGVVRYNRASDGINFVVDRTQFLDTASIVYF